MCLTLIRPLLGYATQIWSPQSIDMIGTMERTQRCATKYLLNLLFTCSNSYTSRLQSLNLLPLCYWHEFLDLFIFFEIVNSMVTINPSVVLKVRCTRWSRWNTKTYIVKFVIPRCESTTHQPSFFTGTTSGVELPCWWTEPQYGQPDPLQIHSPKLLFPVLRNFLRSWKPKKI